jgi:PAS domain S-box-containing protein
MHDIITALNVCSITFDLDEKKFLVISPSVNAVLGYSIPDFYQNTNLLYDIIDREDRDAVKLITDKLSVGEHIELNYRVNTNEGKKWVRDKRSISYDRHNGHRILESIICETDEGMSSGKESHPDLGFLFKNHPNPMWVYEISSLRILDVNKAAIERYGYSESEFLAMNISNLRPAAELEKLNNYLYQKDLSESDNQGFNRGGVWKHQTKQGELIYAEITSHYLKFINSDCRVVVATDVTERVKYQEEAKLREQFLNSLIDSQTNFLIRLNADGFFTFVNKQFLKIFGHKKNEIIGKHFSITTMPDEIDLRVSEFINCIEHPGKVIQSVHRTVDKTGNIHNTEWEFIAITNEDGRVTEIQGIGQDITHKLKIEQEIKKTADRLDIFIESTTDSFFILNTKWEFVRVNAAFEKISRKSREELLGKVIWELFPMLIGTIFEKSYRKALEQNINLQFIDSFESANMWFNTTVYSSPDGLTIFIKNITDEKRAQEEVMWTKYSLEALINNTEDQIWSVDKETRYVYMNKAYRNRIARITGAEPKEGDYSYRHHGYSEEAIEEWNEYYARALAGERYSIINESVDPLTQQTLSFEISFNPIYKVKGDITGIGCFARNITERLKSEKAIIDQNERLRHIASLTSHELRRPVASMLGLINIMDRVNFFNPDNKEIIDHLLTVGNEIDEVIRLIVDKTFTGDHPNKYNAP